MNFEIIPYASFGPVKIGASRTSIMEKLKQLPHRRFRKFSAGNEDDVYDNILSVEYDNNDNAQAFEIANNDEHPVTLWGHSIFPMSYSEAFDFLKQYDKAIEEDESGLTSKKLGIALYAPDVIENRNAKIEGILVFKRGYYDQ